MGVGTFSYKIKYSEILGAPGAHHRAPLRGPLTAPPTPPQNSEVSHHVQGHPKKGTTASQLKSPFLNRRRNRKDFPQREAHLAIFYRKTHCNRNRIVAARNSPPGVWTSLWEPLAVIQCSWPYNETLKKIAAYSFDRVNKLQTSTANHRAGDVGPTLRRALQGAE